MQIMEMVPMYDFSSAAGICSFVFGIVLFLGLDFLLWWRGVRKPIPWILIGALETIFTVAGAFGMWYLALPSLMALGVMSVILLSRNETTYQTTAEHHHFSFKDLFKRKKKGVQPEYIFDREKVYQEVYKAVINMSRVKRGALITFVKKDNILDDSKIGTVIKQRGVDLNAPVKAELLETIFYEGTRLHDGAVVIKDDKIARAAVFFQSTSKALTGKYGARHQAALGISENSDSVTIIVSEETGRISIAFQGELTSVNPDSLASVFEEDMAYESSEDNDENA